MDLELLTQHVEGLQQRVIVLQHQAATSAPEPAPLIDEAFAELDTALEELRAVEHELVEQHATLQDVHAALTAERQRYQELFEGAPDAYVVTDLSGKIQAANRAASALLNYPVERLRNKPLNVFVTRSEFSSFMMLLHRLRRGEAGQDWYGTLQPRQSSPIPVHATVAPVHNGQQAAGTLRWLICDITAQQQAEQQIKMWNATLEQRVHERTAQLQASEDRYRRLVEGAPYAIAVHREGRLLFINHAGAWLLGVPSPADLIGTPLAAFIHPADHDDAGEHLSPLRAGGSEAVPWELRFVRRDGTVVEVEVTSIPCTYEDQPAMYLVAHDITERKRAEAQLQRAAWYDPLTGLPNRARFLDRLRHVLQRVKRHPSERFAVLFLDLDHFKVVNDSLGHVLGDALLAEVAHRLAHCVREEDMVARFGGDEFAVVLEHIAGASDAILIAERIFEALAVPIIVHDHELTISTSVGITLSAPRYASPEELLRDADIALYRAKAQGKARYVIFDAAMHKEAMRRLHLEGELRRAVERQQLVLHYQPIVSLHTGTIVGVEVLLRWQHPAHGLLGPTTFVPLAEETGLIVPLGEWVLHAACAQAKAWHDAGLSHGYMAVNLSARQFKLRDLHATIIHALNATGLPPAYLQLELTESCVMDDVASSIVTLQHLQTTGVQLAIDDFGTGYSSLSYLQRLPVTTLKVDRSFVRNTPGDPHNAAIVAATIAMARQLGLHVTAEGVETEAQLAFLRAHHCDAIQGYCVSEPLPAPAITPLLHQAPWTWRVGTGTTEKYNEASHDRLRS